MDTSSEITGFHNDNVTLLLAERTEMRDRRDTNRSRVKCRLAAKEKPTPNYFCSQGSYVDKTMVQYPDKDYDIDDGVYFREEDLVGKNGGPISAYSARKMIQDALDDGSFKTPPELHENCIRVIYDAGYNVDIPVYKIVDVTDVFGNVTETKIQLASVDWIDSDPKPLRAWFNETNKSLSPDNTNGKQFRRIVRLIKFYASSRKSWRKRNLSGFGITILASRCFRPSLNRDDQALIWTMQAMLAELNGSLKIQCPVPPYDMVASYDDAKAAFFRDRLDEISDKLIDLETASEKNDALRIWSQIFKDSYFSDQITESASAKTYETKTAHGSGVAAIAGLAALGLGAALIASKKDDAGPSEPVSKSGGRMNA